MLILIEITFHKLFEIFQAHLPGFPFFRLHLVKSHLAESATHVFLESVVEKGAATQTTSADSGLLNPQRL